MHWFWYFAEYSFLGFVLEVIFARVTGHPKRDRKCLILLPLCPVYGVGALLILWLTRLAGGVLWTMCAGFLAATGAELLLGALYRFLLGVKFWDYSALRWNLWGMVCLRFSLYWTVLALVLVYGVHPVLAEVTGLIPKWLDPPAVILLTADMAVSAAALRRTGSTEVLRWYL